MTTADFGLSVEVRAPHRRTPTWVRLIGGRYYEDRTARCWWGEFSLLPRSLGIGVCLYETASLNIALWLFQVFIRLPFLDGAADLHDGLGRYGFSIHGGLDNMNDAHFCWGEKTKVISFPWQKHYRGAHAFLAESGAWLSSDRKWRSWEPKAPGRAKPWTQALPYHYLLDNGEVQHVTAIVNIERSKIGWRWFGNGPISKRLRSLQAKLTPWHYWLEVAFDGEVGGRAGSWKGGCTGCSWEMRAGESPEQALVRMQRERRFR